MRFPLRPSLLLLLLAAAALSGRAADLPVCPAWEITVVNPAGQPVAGCHVLQVWGCDFPEHYAGSQTNAVTGADGRVRFPARHVEAPATPAWRKAARRLEGKSSPLPVASLHVSHPGHAPIWISSHRDPRVTATPGGLRSRLILAPAKP
ncbi:MAG: hypothetical protein RJA22_1204 [Verrucomicrobiota bacterium]|jgi:hypothetical protein